MQNELCRAAGHRGAPGQSTEGEKGLGQVKQESISRTLRRVPFLVTLFRNILMGPDLGQHRIRAVSQGWDEETPWGTERDTEKPKLYIVVRTGVYQSSTPTGESGIESLCFVSGIN